MADLIVSSPPLTMSSLEISRVVEQRHDNVKRTIETLGSKGVITLPQIEEVKNHGPGPKAISVYNLGKRDSLIVVAQLCPEFTARIVDRWQELEANEAPRHYLVPQTLPEALRLAADLAEQKDRAEAQLAIAAPKADALDRIATADGCLGLQAAGKALQQPPNKFVDWLRQRGWIYRRAGSSTNLGREEKVRSGYLTHKVKTIDLPDGGERVCEQVMITPKGLARLAQMLGVEPTNGGGVAA